MKHCLSVSLTVVAAFVNAADVVVDFESPDERKAAPRLSRRDYSFGVTNFCASSGTWAFSLNAPKWTDGAYEWPGFTLKPKISDWSGYDRFVVDVVNLADGGDILCVNVAGPEGKTNLGLSDSLNLPAWSYARWVVDLESWPKETCPTNIARLHFYTHKPESVCVFLDRFVLLRPGDPLPPAPSFDNASVRAVREGRAAWEARRAARRKAFLGLLAKENVAAGVRPDGFLVGVASSMEGVRPKDTLFALGPRKLSLGLARNESEALQVLVVPTDGDLKDVAVKVSPLRLKTSAWKRMTGRSRVLENAVKVSVVGCVETTSRPRYPVGYNVATNEAPGYVRVTKRAPLGWWPDPLLDFLESVDVKDGDVQSFWVGVRAPQDALPGTYEGEIYVSARGRRMAKFPFSVRVYGFEIPKTPPMPLLVPFSPSVYVRPDRNGAKDRKLRELAIKKPDSPINIWKTRREEWCDFLADHFLTIMPLYQHGGELPYDLWDRLKAQGRMGLYNLCYFSSQPLDTPERKKKWDKWSDWAASVIGKRWEEAKAHGLESNCVFYCCDEASPKRFPEIDAMIEKFKARFPQIPFATTSYDDSLGMGEHLGKMDIFIPATTRFDMKKAEASRAAGHKVWWYYACDQKAPEANAFTECQPIEQRLLMGAMAAKWRPDGFLYYQTAYFNSLDCITSGPYTAWSPRSWWREHGDATWMAVGPGGRPLSTLRFENFRDGLEDLWYVELLRRKLAENPSAPWAAHARELLAVPRSVVDTLRNFTDDPAALYAWRDEIARLIEGQDRTGSQTKEKGK